MSLSPELLSILACPEDKGPLYYLGDDGGLYNPRLKRRYKITDGIPIMLIDEADELSADEDAALAAQVAAEGVEPTFAQ